MPKSKFTEEIKKKKLLKDIGEELRLVNYAKIMAFRKAPYINGLMKAQHVYQMERKSETLQTENDIFKKSGCGTNLSNKEKIEAIERLKGEFTVHTICKTLNILRSTYYYHQKTLEKTSYEMCKEVFDLSQGKVRSNQKSNKV